MRRRQAEWASRLSPQQIRDTVEYLKTFKKTTHCGFVGLGAGFVGEERERRSARGDAAPINTWVRHVLAPESVMAVAIGNYATALGFWAPKRTGTR